MNGLTKPLFVHSLRPSKQLTSELGGWTVGSKPLTGGLTSPSSLAAPMGWGPSKKENERE